MQAGWALRLITDWISTCAYRCGWKVWRKYKEYFQFNYLIFYHRSETHMKCYLKNITDPFTFNAASFLTYQVVCRPYVPWSTGNFAKTASSSGDQFHSRISVPSCWHFEQICFYNCKMQRKFQNFLTIYGQVWLTFVYGFINEYIKLEMKNPLRFLKNWQTSIRMS